MLDLQVGDRKVSSVTKFNCSHEGSTQNGWSIAAGYVVLLVMGCNLQHSNDTVVREEGITVHNVM